MRDLEQRLTKTSDSKVVAEEKLQSSEGLVRSLQDEIKTTTAKLEAKTSELTEVNDKVCTC